MGKRRILSHWVGKKHVFFVVEGSKGDEYCVIWSEDLEKWGCTCPFGSIWGKGKECIHVQMCKRKLKDEIKWWR